VNTTELGIDDSNTFVIVLPTKGPTTSPTASPVPMAESTLTVTFDVNCGTVSSSDRDIIVAAVRTRIEAAVGPDKIATMGTECGSLVVVASFYADTLTPATVDELADSIGSDPISASTSSGPTTSTSSSRAGGPIAENPDLAAGANSSEADEGLIVGAAVTFVVVGGLAFWLYTYFNKQSKKKTAVKSMDMQMRDPRQEQIPMLEERPWQAGDEDNLAQVSSGGLIPHAPSIDTNPLGFAPRQSTVVLDGDEAMKQNPSAAADDLDKPDAFGELPSLEAMPSWAEGLPSGPAGNLRNRRSSAGITLNEKETQNAAVFQVAQAVTKFKGSVARGPKRSTDV